MSRPIPLLTLEYHLFEENIEQTIACVDRLAEMGSLSINISLGEKLELAWEEWVDYYRFHSDFPRGSSDTLLRLWRSLHQDELALKSEELTGNGRMGR